MAPLSEDSTAWLQTFFNLLFDDFHPMLNWGKHTSFKKAFHFINPED